MRVFLLIFITVIFSQDIFSQEKLVCKDAKRGKFFYIPPNGGEVVVKRKKHKQIEIYNNENQRFIFKIEWYSDCAYILTLKKTIGVDSELKKTIIGTTLNCEIVESNLDHHTLILKESLMHPERELKLYSK